MSTLRNRNEDLLGDLLELRRQLVRMRYRPSAKSSEARLNSWREVVLAQIESLTADNERLARLLEEARAEHEALQSVLEAGQRREASTVADVWRRGGNRVSAWIRDYIRNMDSMGGAPLLAVQASSRRRLLGELLDVLVAISLAVALFPEATLIVQAFTAAIVVVLYAVISVYAFGATVGMWAVGVRIVPISESLSLADSVRRATLGRVLPAAMGTAAQQLGPDGRGLRQVSDRVSHSVAIRHEVAVRARAIFVAGALVALVCVILIAVA